MIDFFAPELWPFQAAAFSLVFLMMLFVAGVLDHILDSIHLLDGVESAMDKAATLLHMGKIPVSLMLVSFLAPFAGAGFSIAQVYHDAFNTLPPTWLSAPIAGIGALLISIPLSRIIAKIIPPQESEAISEVSFLWKPCTIEKTPTAPGLPGEASVKDSFGHVHYLLVYSKPEEELKLGPAVIVESEAGRFVASSK